MPGFNRATNNDRALILSVCALPANHRFRCARDGCGWTGGIAHVGMRDWAANVRELYCPECKTRIGSPVVSDKWEALLPVPNPA